jgi:hypothetical protein
MQAIAVMLALCGGASGRSLDAVIELVVDYCGKRLVIPPQSSDPTDAWIALSAAEFALARPGRISDAARLATLKDRLLAPALRRIAAPAPARQDKAAAARIAIVASTPYLHAIDPGARCLAEVLGHASAFAVAPPALRVFPLQAPDSAFLARADGLGIEIAEPPDSGGIAASHVARRLEALRDSIRAWSPDMALNVGDGVFGLAALALGLAPAQGVYGNRLAVDELPGIHGILANQTALSDWLRPGSPPAAHPGGSVGVAAR